jgi:hypothetical protein
MLAALAAHASLHIGGVRAVLEVIPAARGQGGLKGCRPLLVGLGEAPHLIGCQAKLAQHRTERPAAAESI